VAPELVAFRRGGRRPGHSARRLRRQVPRRPGPRGDVGRRRCARPRARQLRRHAAAVPVRAGPRRQGAHGTSNPTAFRIDRRRQSDRIVRRSCFFLIFSFLKLFYLVHACQAAATREALDVGSTVVQLGELAAAAFLSIGILALAVKVYPPLKGYERICSAALDAAACLSALSKC
jgi:hypothetical protein